MSIYQSYICRASKWNFARRNKTVLRPGNRLRLLSKLRIVENTPKLFKKIKVKRLWLRLRDPSEIHMPLLGSPDRCTDWTPSHRLCIYRFSPIVVINNYLRNEDERQKFYLNNKKLLKPNYCHDLKKVYCIK